MDKVFPPIPPTPQIKNPDYYQKWTSNAGRPIAEVQNEKNQPTRIIGTPPPAITQKTSPIQLHHPGTKIFAEHPPVDTKGYRHGDEWFDKSTGNTWKLEWAPGGGTWKCVHFSAPNISFSAELAGSVQTDLNVPFTIKANANIYDNCGCYDAKTGIYTIDQIGFYDLECHIVLAGVKPEDREIFAYFQVDKDKYSIWRGDLWCLTDSRGRTTIAGSYKAYLTTGNKVSLVLSSSQPTSLTVMGTDCETHNTCFCLNLINRATK